MKLECTSCGYAIPAADINIRLAIAKCPRCSEVFGFADRLDQDDDAGGILRVGLPRRFKVEQDGGELRVEYRWFRHEFWFLAVWCSGWMGIVAYCLVEAAGEVAQKGLANGPWGAVLALSGMGTVGLGITYYALALAFNRTIVRLTSLGELSVWKGPLPWWGNRRLAAADIKQLFCLPTPWNVNGRPYYDVWMLQADQTRHKFVGGLPEIDQALFIEQTLESALGLPDEPVPGEAG